MFDTEIVSFRRKVPAPSSSFSMEKTQPRINHVLTTCQPYFHLYLFGLYGLCSGQNIIVESVCKLSFGLRLIKRKVDQKKERAFLP